MTTYALTIIRVPRDPQGDLIHRTHLIKANTLAEAEHSSVVSRLVSCMDNVIDWQAIAV